MEKKRTKKKDGEDGRAFGARVSALRKAKGLTQESLAALIGTPKSTVASWEAGHMGNNPKLLLELCRKLSTPESPVSFQFLLTGELDAQASIDIGEYFEKSEILTGLCEVTIRRLTPKQKK